MTTLAPPRPLSLDPAATDLPPPRSLESAGLPAPRSVEAKEDPSLIDAAIRGVKTSINPFGMSPEEVNRERTGGEVAAETAANVATDIFTSIGAAALAGAAVGSVVPGAGTAAGTVAGLGMGIYRALGYEDIQSRAKGEKFNLGRAALSVATEVNPLLKFGGKLAKGASQGVLQSLQTLAYGGSGGAAVISGLVGGGIAGVAHKGKLHALSPEDKTKQIAGITSMIADEGMGPEKIQRLVDVLDEGDNSLKLSRRAYDAAKANAPLEQNMARVFGSDTLFDDLQDTNKLSSLFADAPDVGFRIGPEEMKAARSLARRELILAGQKIDKQAIREMAPALAKQQAWESEAAGFARYILNKPGEPIGPELFQAAKDKMSRSSLSNAQAFEMYRTQKYLKDAAFESAAEAAEAGTGIKDPLGNVVFRKLSDLKFAARAIDRTTGLNIDGLTDKVSYSKNVHGAFMFDITHGTNKLLKDAKKAGLDRTSIVKQLEDGADKTATGAQGDVLRGFRKLFDEIREYGNNNGLQIDYLDNYVTRLSKDPAEMVTTIRRRALQFRGGKAILRPEALEDTDLHKVLKQLTDVDVPKDPELGARAIRRALNMLDNHKAIKSQEGFDATGTFKRRHGLPEFAREQDIGKVLIRYANNTSKSIHMQPVIKELQTQTPVLNALGMKNSADYIERLVKDLSGMPSEFLGWTNAAQVRWKTGIDEIIDAKELSGLSLKAAEAAKVMPDFISWSISLLYPNYLGLNLKSTLRNYTQAHMTGAPEIGGKYGYKVMTKAFLETARDKKGGVNLEKALSDLGYIPGQHIGEGMNEAASAMRATMIGPAVVASDKLNEKMMWFYSKSDAINRYVTMKASKQLTKDILAGIRGEGGADSEAALKFVGSLSPGMKSSIYTMAKEGQLDKLEDGITRYLIGKTQFNYGPQASGEAVRSMGRLFGMFTKWPAMIGGDTHELLIARKEYAKWGQKYLAPFMILGGLNLWMNDTKDSPRKRALLGRSLLDISPLSALGGVSVPPIIEMAGSVGKSLMDAAAFDFESAGKNLGKTLSPVIPLAHGLERAAAEVHAAVTNSKRAPWRSRDRKN